MLYVDVQSCPVHLSNTGFTNLHYFTLTAGCHEDLDRSPTSGQCHIAPVITERSMWRLWISIRSCPEDRSLKIIIWIYLKSALQFPRVAWDFNLFFIY